MNTDEFVDRRDARDASGHRAGIAMVCRAQRTTVIPVEEQTCAA